MNYQKLYFEEELNKKKIDEIKSMNFSKKEILIKEVLITKIDEK